LKKGKTRLPWPGQAVEKVSTAINFFITLTMYRIFQNRWHVRLVLKTPGLRTNPSG
jgi:hypothetical protein